jgi:gliding motility-associated protein GldC
MQSWKQAPGTMSRTAEIRLTVDLDDGNLPVRLSWEASDSPDDGPKPCQAMMLSLWHGDTRTTAAIDLWIMETTIEEMSVYFCQVLHKMADTYLRATRNADVANLIHEFGNDLEQRLGLTPKEAPEPAAREGGG